MHSQNCSCVTCEMMKAGLTYEEAKAAAAFRPNNLIGKYDWICHAVTHDPESPTGYNVHTHGVMEFFQHPDLQIVLPIEPEIAHGVLSTIVEKIKEGQKFADGDVVAGLLNNGYKCKFINARENGRHVLRVILPDKEGRLDELTILPKLRIQYRQGSIAETIAIINKNTHN